MLAALEGTLKVEWERQGGGGRSEGKEEEEGRTVRVTLVVLTDRGQRD